MDFIVIIIDKQTRNLNNLNKLKHKFCQDYKFHEFLWRQSILFVGIILIKGLYWYHIRIIVSWLVKSSVYLVSQAVVL